jgi:Protein of unknown function (DUF3352)
VLPGEAGAPGPLLVLAVDDPAGARAFLGKLGGESEARKYRGVEVTSHRPNLSSAERDGFLLLGVPPAVRASIDAVRGGEDSLDDSEGASQVRDELPDNRVADVYVSEDGIGRLLAGRGGLAGQLDTFTDFGASEGIAAGLVAREDGFELELFSALDPEAAKATPSFFSAFPTFEPTLASQFAPDTLALLAVGDPSRTVTQLLDQAQAAFPGIAEAFDRIAADLAREGGVDIEEELLPLLRAEAAVGVVPARPLPYAVAVFDDVDEEKTREAVARLQAPLIAALNPARTGQAPTLSSRRLEDVRIQSVRLQPNLELAYAVFDDRLVVATDSAGVEQAIRGSADLAETDGYRATTRGSGGVSALVFLNLAGLVTLAEPRGLAEIVSEFREDLALLRALSLTVRSEESSLETEVFLNIEEPEEASP